MKKSLFIILTCLLATNVAYAKWNEVSTDHFVIYAEHKEKKIIEFGKRLERYHSAMNWLFSRTDVLPGPSNRLTIYVVRTQRQVRDFSNSTNKDLAGFYIARAGGSIAVISSIRKGTKGVSQSEQILLHEYAHHFLTSSSSSHYPHWVTEGSAEFFSSAKFEADGAIGLGYPAYHRKSELKSFKKIPIHTLLDTESYLKSRSNRGDSFYGQSWLLFHMLQFSKERQGQFSAYFQALDEGKSEIDAAESAFGDLTKLDEELDAYRKQKIMSYVPIPANELTIGSVAVRSLTEGEAKAMHFRIRLKRGADKKQLAELLPKVRKLSQMYPDDLGVLAIAAEAEFYDNNADKAIALADRIIAHDASNVYAQTLKGLAMTQIEIDQNGSNTGWENVRKQINVAIQLDNKNPVPHFNYFQSYMHQKIMPPKNAISALEWALLLAPFDNNLRLNVANHYINTQQYSAAIYTLKPLTAAAHKPELRKLALEMITDTRLRVQTN